MKDLTTSDSLSFLIEKTSFQSNFISKVVEDQKKFIQQNKQGLKGQKYWTIDESLLYYRFVKNNILRLSKQHFTKKYNKFVQMSMYITSKTVAQCRSHHQKIIKKYETLDRFLSDFEQGKLYKNGTKTIDIGIQVKIMQQRNQTLSKSHGSSGPMDENLLLKSLHNQSIVSPQQSPNFIKQCLNP